MTHPPAEDTYSLTRIVAMLGLSRGVISGLIRAGYVTPRRGPRNEYRFTFRDIVLLRTAHQLRARQIPSRRLLRSLRELRAKLPASLPMSELRITAVGNEVVVRDQREHWAAETGQLLFDFSVGPGPGSGTGQGSTSQVVSFVDRVTQTTTPPGATGKANVGASRATVESDATYWLHRAEELEPIDSMAAEHAYRQVIRLTPQNYDAYLNLGAMLCEVNENQRAIEVFDAGLARRPEVALLHFNRAVALEDLGRQQEALAGYQRCIELDPDLADAHFNVARLHEERGNTQEAVRHYSAYRRLHRT